MTVYSHSKLSTFRSCPWQYKLRYLDRVRETEEGVEAFMGSRVHSALEKLYRCRQKSHPFSLEDALEHYEGEWDRNWHDGVRVVRAEFAPEDYRETGRRCVRDYWRRYEPFDQGVPVGIERRVSVDLDSDKRIRLTGYIDRLDRVADGVYEIHDYKTSSSLPEQATADLDPQLALYQIAVENMWPDVREVTLVWHYLAFDAEIRSKRSPETLAQLREDTLALIAEIEAEEEFEARESSLCDWCGLGALCPRKKHEIETSALEPADFSAEAGVALVNRFVELQERKSALVGELDEQIEEVRKELIAYANGNGLQVVVGADHRVTVRAEHGFSVPKKGSPEREALEAEVRALGKWEEASCLDTYGVAKAISEGLWDERTCERLSQFLTRCESYRVTKSKLRTGRASD